MQKFLIVLLMLVPVSMAFAGESRPKRRGCQRQLVNGRFIEATPAELQRGYIETYESIIDRGGGDDVYVDRYSGDYNARDPGDF